MFDAKYIIIICTYNLATILDDCYRYYYYYRTEEETITIKYFKNKKVRRKYFGLPLAR